MATECATDINDASQVVGSGCLNAQTGDDQCLTGLTRAFLLIPPSSTILSGLRSKVVEIVGQLIGFQTVDGSGIVIVNGVPILVGPWGPSVGEYVQKSDILVSLAVEELATHINNVESQVTVWEAALKAARAQIEQLLTKLARANKPGGVLKHTYWCAAGVALNASFPSGV